MALSKRCDETQHEEKASPDIASAASSSAGTLRPEGDIVLGSSGLLCQIQKLRAEQQALKDVKKQLAKDMKNAVRQKKRLQTRAMTLTDNDLVEVLRMRKAKKTGEAQTDGTAQG